jgi:hypothetical protein
MARDEEFLEECGPTRLIDDGSLRVLRAKSRTLDGSLPAAQPPRVAPTRRRTPRGLRYWALPVMLVAAATTWTLLHRDEQVRAAVPEPARVVMPIVTPVVTPAAIEMPDDAVERATPAPRKPTASAKKSVRAKRAALRRSKTKR